MESPGNDLQNLRLALTSKTRPTTKHRAPARTPIAEATTKAASPDVRKIAANRRPDDRSGRRGYFNARISRAHCSCRVAAPKMCSSADAGLSSRRSTPTSRISRPGDRKMPSSSRTSASPVDQTWPANSRRALRPSRASPHPHPESRPQTRARPRQPTPPNRAPRQIPSPANQDRVTTKAPHRRLTTACKI
jgi:hypothetical protein